jgi:signal recognition particle subunit SRP72
VRSKPAVLATTASLYHEAGESDRAAAVLRSANDSAVQADFMMSQGRYDEAAALYEKAVDESDPSSTARLVRALSYTDPSRAAKLWSEISPELVTEEEDGVDGADLEVKELPRLKTVRKSEILSQQQEVKSKKSHGAVLRRRARKREEYLTALQERGLYSAERPTQPDPERWIPKYERASAGRRRRRRPPHKGAQGGLSDKDAAKLDVAARQQAAKAGVVDSKSTAHMKVAGGGKGGRRR